MGDDRSSEAEQPELVEDRQEKAKRESENTLQQFDYAMTELSLWLTKNDYILRPSTILTLNRYALDGLSNYAGVFRPSGVKISGSRHVPVEAADVALEVEKFCDYINSNWQEKTALHLAAYALWRLNWIHPFVDGNGRTARIISYLIMCAKHGSQLPGKSTIPEQISRSKNAYYVALEDADKHYKIGRRVDVSRMEGLLNSLLAKQLVSVHDDVTGNRGGSQQVRSNSESSSDDAINQPVGNFRAIVQVVERHPTMAMVIVTLLVATVGLFFGT